jgi:hypothetical protein
MKEVRAYLKAHGRKDSYYGKPVQKEGNFYRARQSVAKKKDGEEVRTIIYQTQRV